MVRGQGDRSRASPPAARRPASGSRARGPPAPAADRYACGRATAGGPSPAPRPPRRRMRRTGSPGRRWAHSPGPWAACVPAGGRSGRGARRAGHTVRPRTPRPRPGAGAAARCSPPRSRRPRSGCTAGVCSPAGREPRRRPRRMPGRSGSGAPAGPARRAGRVRRAASTVARSPGHRAPSGRPGGSTPRHPASR